MTGGHWPTHSTGPTPPSRTVDEGTPVRLHSGRDGTADPADWLLLQTLVMASVNALRAFGDGLGQRGTKQKQTAQSTNQTRFSFAGRRTEQSTRPAAAWPYEWAMGTTKTKRCNMDDTKKHALHTHIRRFHFFYGRTPFVIPGVHCTTNSMRICHCPRGLNLFFFFFL